MPNFEITSPDGLKYQVTAPDGATQEQAMQFAQAQIAAGTLAPKNVAAPQGATGMQKIQSSLPLRFIQGMRDPIDAAAQMFSHAIPASVNDALDYIPSKLRDSKSPLISTLANAYLADPRPVAVDKAISQNEQNYQGARSATAPATLETLVSGKRDPGADIGRFAGNMLSPANAATARIIPAGAMSSVPKMAATGATLGAAGGAMTPVSDVESQGNFATTKATQAAGGAVSGAITTPLMGKVLEAAAPRVQAAITAVRGRTGAQGVSDSLQTDEIIRQALRQVGAAGEDIPAAQMRSLRSQVSDALRGGRRLDAAAALRKSDFDALGMNSTQGQITRDPTQFARERNLRGVAGVGEPLQALFTGQNETLQRNIGNAASGASDKVTAGEQLANALRSADAPVKGRVDAAYNTARDNLGRAAPMDSAEFSRQANLSLDDQMLGASLPPDVRNILNGVTRGEIPFTVNSAVQMDKFMSAAQRRAGQGTPEHLAIGKVRDALNSAPIADNVGEDAKRAFDDARGMAAQRFRTLDANPAMAGSVDNSIHADDFVRKFLINGKAAETQRLAQALSQSNPEAFQQARAQIGAEIQRAAFGENQAGDKLLAPERLAKTLRDIGPQKLGAFFSPQEVDQLRRVGRVGSYINSSPAAAAVNTSNTASAGLNLLGRIPGIGMPARIAAAIANPVVNQMAVRSAMRPTVPSSTYASPEAIRRAQLAAALSGLGAGTATGSVGQ